MNERRAVMWLLALPILAAMLEDALGTRRRSYNGDSGDETPEYLPPLPDWMPEEEMVAALGPVKAEASLEEVRRWQFLKWLRETGQVKP